jgi:hypothetical protein
MRSNHQAKKAIASAKLEFFGRMGIPGIRITILLFGVMP